MAEQRSRERNYLLARNRMRKQIADSYHDKVFAREMKIKPDFTFKANSFADVALDYEEMDNVMEGGDRHSKWFKHYSLPCVHYRDQDTGSQGLLHLILLYLNTCPFEVMQKTARHLKQAIVDSYDVKELQQCIPAVIKKRHEDDASMQGLAIIQTEDLPDEATLVWFSNFDTSTSSFFKIWSKKKQNIFSPWTDVTLASKQPVAASDVQV